MLEGILIYLVSFMVWAGIISGSIIMLTCIAFVFVGIPVLFCLMLIRMKRYYDNQDY